MHKHPSEVEEHVTPATIGEAHRFDQRKDRGTAELRILTDQAVKMDTDAAVADTEGSCVLRSLGTAITAAERHCEELVKDIQSLQGSLCEAKSAEMVPRAQLSRWAVQKLRGAAQVAASRQILLEERKKLAQQSAAASRLQGFMRRRQAARRLLERFVARKKQLEEER